MEITKKYIEKNLLTKDLKLNPNKTKLIPHTNEELYLIYHGNNKPLCKFCHKKYTKFQTFNKGYRDFCSSKCAAAGSWDKSKQTRLEKYGDENFTNRKKALETAEAKYGDKNFNNRKKFIETNLNKFGVENPSQNKSIKKKKETTTRQNYGVNNPFSSIEIKERSKQTRLNKYGVEFFSQSEIHRMKMEENCNWIPLSEKSDFELYSMKVRNLTERLDLDKIPNINLRGAEYHLDHKVSVYYGFKNSIPIHLIANLENLQIIRSTDNLKKGTSSIDILNILN